MTQGPFRDVPIACTLPTIAEAKAQVEKWQAFDADYVLSSERTDSELVVHYAKVDDSISRLRELVEVEQRCCAFVQWNIDENDSDLRLIARGSEEQLAALNVPLGSPTPNHHTHRRAPVPVHRLASHPR